MGKEIEHMFVPIGRRGKDQVMPERNTGDEITERLTMKPCGRGRCQCTRALRYKLRGLTCRGCGHPRQEQR